MPAEDPTRQELAAELERLRQRVAELEATEIRLRESEKALKSVLRAAPIGIGLVSNKTLMWANEAFSRITGYSVAELVAHSPRVLYQTIEEFLRVRSENYREMEQDRTATVETRWRRKDGNVLDILLGSRALEPPNISAGVVFAALDITALKNADKEVREGEARYRALFENISNGVAVYRPANDGEDFVLVDFNTAAETITGVSRETVIGMPISRAFPDVKEFGLLDVLRNTWKTGEPAHLAVSRYKDDRIEIWAENRTCRLPSGEVVAVFSDETERRRAEEALRVGEKAYRTLSENIPGIVYRAYLDEPARMEFFNNMVEAITGYSQHELSFGQTCSLDPLIVPEDRPRVLGIVRQAFVNDTPFEIQYRIKDKFGDIRHFLEYGRPIRGNTDESPRIDGVIFDITSRKKSEEAQERLTTAVEQAAEGILVTDTDGIIQYVNPAVECITGYKKEELIGRPTRIFKSGEHDHSFYEKLWATIKGGQVWTGRIINKKKDGALYHEEMTISPVRDANGKIINFVALKRDISSQLELSRQLLQAQKMEAVGILAGGIAHDFNNLLQIVLGYSDMVLLEEGLPQRVEEDLWRIRESARSGADLVHGLMAFSRKTESRPRPTNLNQQIEHLSAMLSRTIPKMIEIRLVLADDLEPINADPAEMEQVLMNLAVNARDAMPDGGELVIETRNIVLDADDAKIHPGTKPGCYVMMSVSDTGRGMDEETRAHIFDPFFTTKAPGEGTGLGLAIVYGIVTQHGGHIMCHSQPSKGTTFRIYLPALQGKTETPEHKKTAMPRGGSETVLVVDDEDLIRTLAERILARAGYTVISASDGKSALEAYRSQAGEISLVVLDLVMPEMGGKQCMEELLKINPSAKIIIASGYSSDDRGADAGGTGAKGFVSKPFDVKLLLQTVRDILDGN